MAFFHVYGFAVLRPARNSRSFLIIYWSSLGAAPTCAGCMWKAQSSQGCGKRCFFKGWDRQAWAGGERLGSLFKEEHSQKDSAVKRGEKANPARRSAASRGLQTVTALPFYFLLLLPSYFLTWQQCHMCITVSRALRAGAGAAGFLPPHLVFARALHCRKDHSSPPRQCTSPLYPRGLVTFW